MPCPDHPPHPDAHDEEHAIAELLGRLDATWARGDAAGYAALFTDEADYVAFDGTRLRGAAANRDSHQALFAGVLAGTRLAGELESIRFVSPTVAIVHSHGAVLWPWQRRPSPRVLSRQTLVLSKVSGRWRIEAFHNTRIRPAPAPGGLGMRLFRAWVSLRTRLARGASDPPWPGGASSRR